MRCAWQSLASTSSSHLHQEVLHAIPETKSVTLIPATLRVSGTLLYTPQVSLGNAKPLRRRTDLH